MKNTEQIVEKSKIYVFPKTKEDILETVQAFKFFDKDLVPIKELWENLDKKDEEDIKDYMHEVMIANRLLTVRRNLEYIDKNKNGSIFKKFYFFRRITNPNEETDEFGMIPKWGVKMTPETYANYESVYKLLFETNEVV